MTKKQAVEKTEKLARKAAREDHWMLPHIEGGEARKSFREFQCRSFNLGT